MNKERRKALNEIIEQLNVLRDEVESLKDEEEYYYDAMPEDIPTQGLYYDDIDGEKRTIDMDCERSIKRYEQEQKQQQTYEQLMQFCKDTQTSQAGVLTLLCYYTDTLGWGMQESLDYVVGLFENGTIQKIKELGGMVDGK